MKGCEWSNSMGRGPSNAGSWIWAELYVRKVAPLGDPIEITVRDYELSLRKADAEMIEVE